MSSEEVQAMISEIRIFDCMPPSLGVILMEDKGNGFRFLEVDGRAVRFSTVEAATEWLLK